MECDVAIVGAGGAGIAAALEVADAGGKAVLIEQVEELGGTAAISGGGSA
jgi:urocanate reductase